MIERPLLLATDSSQISTLVTRRNGQGPRDLVDMFLNQLDVTGTAISGVFALRVLDPFSVPVGRRMDLFTPMAYLATWVKWIITHLDYIIAEHRPGIDRASKPRRCSYLTLRSKTSLPVRIHIHASFDCILSRIHYQQWTLLHNYITKDRLVGAYPRWGDHGVYYECVRPNASISLNPEQPVLAIGTHCSYELRHELHDATLLPRPDANTCLSGFRSVRDGLHLVQSLETGSDIIRGSISPHDVLWRMGTVQELEDVVHPVLLHRVLCPCMLHRLDRTL